MTQENARLDELDKEEWLEVALAVQPNITDEEYDAMWEEFQETKRRHKAN
jgi:NAD-dependent DNA ligase